MRGQERADELVTVKDSMFRLAEDIGVSYSHQGRQVDRIEMAEGPPGVGGVPHRPQDPCGDLGRGGASRQILTPPEGKNRWTLDEANRRTGRQVVKPVTPLEKVGASHHLATDENVAAPVTSDLLRRPTVVAQVKQEDKVRVVED